MGTTTYLAGVLALCTTLLVIAHWYRPAFTFKTKLWLLEKRLDIYVEADRAINLAHHSRNGARGHIDVYLRYVRRAPWLFGPEVHQYLQGDLLRALERVADCDWEVDQAARGEAKEAARAASLQARADLHEVDLGMDAVFMPYLAPLREAGMLDVLPRDMCR